MLHEELAEQISNNYSRLSDEAILRFAEENGTTLSSMGFTLLCDELHKRNIGSDIINKLRSDKLQLQQEQQQKEEEETLLTNVIEAHESALFLREEGKSDYEVFTTLIEKGCGEGEAYQIIKDLDKNAEILSKDASDEVLSGILIAVLGLILLAIAFSIGRFQIAAGLVIFGGLIRAIHFKSKKDRLKKIRDHGRNTG